ncbi:MAG: cyclic nucleotide-binding domain-containing protein, partial [Dehalococcoidia bacterium]
DIPDAPALEDVQADVEAPPDPDGVIATLQTVNLFRHMGPAQLQKLARATQRHVYEAGATVIRQGDEGLCLYSIISGQAIVVRTSTRDGSEQELAHLGSGDFFGEMALFDAQARSATVRAVTNLECLLLSRWTVTDAVRGDPDVAMAVLEAMSQRLRNVDRMI